MEIIAYPHIVTTTEIIALTLLRFNVEGAPGCEHDFINNHFPNFDLFKMSREISDLLTPLCSENIKKIIQFSNTPIQVSLGILSDNYQDVAHGLGLVRIFTREGDELVVDHTFFRIPLVYRNRGIAKAIFKILLQQYVNIGINRITVHASLVDGGYVWAKHFFTATNRTEVEAILKAAESAIDPQQFKAIKRIYDNYYMKNPDGKEFPIHKWAYLPFMEKVLRGSDWHGTLDLKNPVQFNNFMRYVLR